MTPCEYLGLASDDPQGRVTQERREEYFNRRLPPAAFPDFMGP